MLIHPVDLLREAFPELEVARSLKDDGWVVYERVQIGRGRRVCTVTDFELVTYRFNLSGADSFLRQKINDGLEALKPKTQTPSADLRFRGGSFLDRLKERAAGLRRTDISSETLEGTEAFFGLRGPFKTAKMDELAATIGFLFFQLSSEIGGQARMMILVDPDSFKWLLDVNEVSEGYTTLVIDGVEIGCRRES